MGKQDHLVKAMRRHLETGQWSAGDRITPERQLATDMDVSYMTARSAVQLLVEEGLLVRQGRQGTFVPMDIARRLSRQAIHVIGQATGATVDAAFAREIIKQADKRKIFCNLHELDGPRPDYGRAVRMLEQADTPAIVMMGAHVRQPRLARAMLAHQRIMLVGYDLSAIGIHSVLCDDASAAAQATAHLQQLGHRRIAFLHESSDSPVLEQMLQGFTRQSHDTGEIWALPANKQSIRHRVAQGVAGRWKHPREAVTAVLCSEVRIAHALMQTLRDWGLAVPARVSVMALGIQEPSLELAGHQLCRMDPQLDQQVAQAVTACLKWHRGLALPLVHRVRPRLIEGDSVAEHHNK